MPADIHLATPPQETDTPSSEPTWVSAAEIATHFHVTPQTIRNWSARKLIPTSCVRTRDRRGSEFHRDYTIAAINDLLDRSSA